MDGVFGKPRVYALHAIPPSAVGTRQSPDHSPKTNAGRTPLEVARRAQREEVVTFLESVYPDSSPANETSCMNASYSSEDQPSCSDVNCAIS